MSGTLDETKYIKLDQVRLLMLFCQRSWEETNGRILPIRDAFMVELGLSAGLRVHEMVALQCRDLQTSNGMRSIVVRKGKGDKRRVVRISDSLSAQCARFLELKLSLGEPVTPESPVFYSPRSRGALSRRSLQRAFKRVIQKVNLPTYFSIHSLRHSFGTHLCRASGYNLRLVQQQMGHASLKSTEVYLHVEDETLAAAVENHSSLILQG